MSEIQTSNWSETANSNNAASPNGWPENMAPSGVNDSARENMAALKRDWNRSHPTVTSAGSSTAYTLTYTTAPAAYAQGLIFAFKVDEACGADPTVNVNSLGAKKVYKNVAGTPTQLVANDWYADQVVILSYDTALDGAAGGFHWLNEKGSVTFASLSEAKTGTDTAKAMNAADVAAVAGGPWTDIASASTVNIGAADVANLRVTGTTTITAFDTIASGVRRKLRFAGALTLTHNGTSLILPGAANITTAANDVAEVVSLGSGNWICTDYQKASGLPVIQNAVLTKSYESADQTISAGGGLTLAHSLGAVPKVIQYFIKCTDAGGEAGYAQNDVLHIPQTMTGWLNSSSAEKSGFNSKIDATNITIRFVDSFTWVIGNATTGAAVTITTTKWALIVRAYA